MDDTWFLEAVNTSRLGVGQYSAAAVRRPLRPAALLFWTGISLCDVCSCYGILRAQRTRVGGGLADPDHTCRYFHHYSFVAPQYKQPADPLHSAVLQPPRPPGPMHNISGLWTVNATAALSRTGVGQG